VEALQHFHQVVGRHRQLECLAAVLRLPADVCQQAEVFAELDAEPLGGGEVLVFLQCDPDVADRAEVITDQLVETVSLVAVDRRGDAGHGRPLSVGHRRTALDQGPSIYPSTEVLWENRSRIEGWFFGAGPRGVRAPPGPLCLGRG
jgi:hypothetical protein